MLGKGIGSTLGRIILAIETVSKVSEAIGELIGDIID